jgi:hypothetical protein
MASEPRWRAFQHDDQMNPSQNLATPLINPITAAIIDPALTCKGRDCRRRQPRPRRRACSPRAFSSRRRSFSFLLDVARMATNSPVALSNTPNSPGTTKNVIGTSRMRRASWSSQGIRMMMDTDRKRTISSRSRGSRPDRRLPDSLAMRRRYLSSLSCCALDRTCFLGPACFQPSNGGVSRPVPSAPSTRSVPLVPSARYVTKTGFIR